MGPIMATTAAVVMGSLPRVVHALTLVAAGVVIVILFSFLLAAVAPEVTLSFTGNGELAARINPDLYALLTALASGAAGAFITSRAEIADSIGGVAIALSLVPPLCVVGIALQHGQPEAALGALLLFLTNFLAILLAGGVVFTALGLSALAATSEQARLRWRGLAVFAVGILFVTIPLAATTYEAVQRQVETRSATDAINVWLKGTRYNVLAVRISDPVIDVAVEGRGDLQPVQALADHLAVTLGHPVTVKVHTVSSEAATSMEP